MEPSVSALCCSFVAAHSTSQLGSSSHTLNIVMCCTVMYILSIFFLPDKTVRSCTVVYLHLQVHVDALAHGIRCPSSFLLRFPLALLPSLVHFVVGLHLIATHGARVVLVLSTARGQPAHTQDQCYFTVQHRSNPAIHTVLLPSLVPLHQNSTAYAVPRMRIRRKLKT